MSADPIAEFLAGRRFAVAGASNDRRKYGNRVLRAYVEHGREAVPVNPREPAVEGLAAVPSLHDLEEPVDGVSIVTPPEVTERLVGDAIDAGITRLWMQPGAEHAGAIRRARAAGLTVIAGGPCVIVELGRRGGA